MQLDYTGAYTYLQEAIRRAPSDTATGFRVTVPFFPPPEALHLEAECFGEKGAQDGRDRAATYGRDSRALSVQDKWPSGAAQTLSQTHPGGMALFSFTHFSTHQKTISFF